ncbi:hypothetical protein HAX54_036273, partial [Datura stramonium]|nr:hypothetical protein [Datura stramonium]
NVRRGHPWQGREGVEDLENLCNLEPKLPVTPMLVPAAESSPASLNMESFDGGLGRSQISKVGTNANAHTQPMRDSPVSTFPLPEQKVGNWTSLFSGNRAAANGLALNYVTPK